MSGWMKSIECATGRHDVCKYDTCTCEHHLKSTFEMFFELGYEQGLKGALGSQDQPEVEAMRAAFETAWQAWENMGRPRPVR